MSVDKSPSTKSTEESSLNSSDSSFRGCWAEEMREQDNAVVRFKYILSSYFVHIY